MWDICFRVTVDKCIGKEIGALFGIYDVHGTEGLVLGSYADNLLGNFDSVTIFGVQTCDEGVGFACLHHHHTEVVALEHLVLG